MERREKCGLVLLLLLGFSAFIVYSGTGLKGVGNLGFSSDINHKEDEKGENQEQERGWKTEQRQRLDLIQQVCKSYNQSSEMERR